MKNKTITLILIFFLGGLGIHKFYLGEVGSGLLRLFFSWTGIPFILSVIDFIIIIFMDKKTFNKKYN